MHRMSHHMKTFVGCPAALCAALLVGFVAAAEDSPRAHGPSTDALWRQTIDLVAHGDFPGATEAIARIPSGDRLTEQVRSWLDAYEAKQAARKELDRAEFEKYTGYAKARIERKEYTRALGWLRAAADVAEDRERFLASDWVHQCINDALAQADVDRKEADWRGSWDVYWQLAELYEREPRYKKLENEVSTHLRLDLMFDKDRKWEEYLERVRWEDAKEALGHVDRYYVEPASFKRLTESGLEQLLLLAESKTARETFNGLGDEDDRNDFIVRLQVKLDQVRAAKALDRADCQGYFRRARDINRQTVRLPEELIVSELARGAFDTLDEFTTVIWPRDSEEFEKRTRGDFIGVGIQIVKNRAQEVEVVTPLDDTPAYRAGIQAGDIITEVDGIALKGHSINKVVDIITGPKGTPVTLTIRREGKDIKFPLVRDLVKIQSVKGTRRNPDNGERWTHWLDEENRIGYLRVTNFQRNTVEDVENSLKVLEADGLKGLVLDLRSNPGGLLDSAYNMSSLFLKRGDDVVSTRGRIARENQRLHAKDDGAFADVPLVVLVNEASASASEIVSGAIRDNHRGAVIGTRTFGKFSVQNLIPLGHSKAKLKITTAKYYLPNGDSLGREPASDRWGVEPDIPVRLARWERMNLYRMRREADLLGPAAPKKDDKPSADEAQGEGDDPAKVEETKEDEKDPHVAVEIGASRFKPPAGFDLAGLTVVVVDPSPLTFGTGKARPESLRDSPNVKGKPPGDVDNEVDVFLDDRRIEVVARGLADQKLKVVGVKAEEGELIVEGADADGKEAIVTTLRIDGKEAERITLPRLQQPDENNRPMEDPQLDTALLLLRVTLLGQAHPTLVGADAEEPQPFARP